MGVLPVSVPQQLAQVLDSAGARSGVDFDYLLQTAIRESSLNPRAKATTSTATGLFQFLESTWLEVMKTEGPRLGYQHYADRIQRDKDGDYHVADKAQRLEILKLREDPQISADLAAAMTRENGDLLFQRFGRMPSPGELYIAHFLGAEGASRFFNAGLANPDQSAAALFPRQAKANPGIFYDGGKSLSVRDVYRNLVAKHAGDAPALDPRFAAQQLATEPAGKWQDAEALPSRFSADDMSFTALFSTSAPVGGRVLLSPAEEAQGGALFTQIYGQRPPGQLVDEP